MSRRTGQLCYTRFTVTQRGAGGVLQEKVLQEQEEALLRRDAEFRESLLRFSKFIQVLNARKGELCVQGATLLLLTPQLS